MGRKGGTSTIYEPKIFSSLALFSPDCGKGGAAIPEGIENKAIEKSGSALQSAHPKSHPAPLNDAPQHATRPEIIDILVSGENTESKARFLLGSVGPSGVDVSSTSGMLLK